MVQAESNGDFNPFVFFFLALQASERYIAAFGGAQECSSSSERDRSFSPESKHENRIILKRETRRKRVQKQEEGKRRRSETWHSLLAFVQVL